MKGLHLFGHVGEHLRCCRRRLEFGFSGHDFIRLFRIRRTACFDSVYASVYGSCLEEFLTFTTWRWTLDPQVQRSGLLLEMLTVDSRPCVSLRVWRCSRVSHVKVDSDPAPKGSTVDTRSASVLGCFGRFSYIQREGGSG